MGKKRRFDFTKKNKRSGKVENVGYLDLEQDEEQSRCSLYFYGDIVSATWESMWYEEDRCPQDIADFLNQLDGYEDIDIYFNSGGGDVFAGLAIYNQLKRYDGHKVGYVDGMAASIASVIMFACDELHFATGAQAMIHKPLCMAYGNADDFKAVIKQLNLCEDSILDVYMEHVQEGVTRTRSNWQTQDCHSRRFREPSKNCHEEVRKLEIIRHIKVDLYGDTQHFAVAAKQMDMGTRYIGVTLMEDGVVYEIPDNVEVIINMTKPDKTHVHNDGEKSGNEALIPLTRGMLQVHGTALCEVQLYQNGALLTSATFEMEIFPSQRDESEIIHSGEYTRLENTIAAAREALQIAQDTQNTIDAAEAVRQAQERLREAAEKAREIKESRREDDTAKAIAKCVEAMEAAIEQTKKCLTATEEANKIIISQSGLDAILAAVKDYYERIRELETDININVDGGTPKSTDLLLVKGGTPFTTDYDKYIAGTSHTI